MNGKNKEIIIAHPLDKLWMLPKLQHQIILTGFIASLPISRGPLSCNITLYSAKTTFITSGHFISFLFVIQNLKFYFFYYK